ncbi:MULTISPECIES: carboxylate/amino acid/amine transporter [Pseudoalteromonas]|uniref:Carboxylate/amino acid/amine transporter n=1 Tax=Pseudoalteromonas obscura TaxID=3048491 RepID=A0ABT7EKC0_9GAMM|nr:MULTISPECIES: carboxylate/amino acid/amine transporter [Pseudoalteromonas]MBQ4837276.1 DMT family transporter [Pseudoalteromonas luteoviolacea]MDK2595501.1 carboxylate/amino acid/amine transporter [Pseudoalteromonas sp. P94(2023)]
MHYLSFVTVLWAFSFSLIGVYLAGQVDSWFAAFSRVVIALLVFLPFTKITNVKPHVAVRLMVIGAIQIGLMYGFYYHSFLYLSVPEVLLFTVMTPVYITVISDLLERKIQLHHLFVALIATCGAITIRYAQLNDDFWFGLMLVQGANICFALGQVLYKRLLATEQLPAQHTCFGFFFFGALIITGLSYAILGNENKLPTTQLQWGVLIYLGLVASGLGYFLWNKGATLVSVGTLAIMNNVLIPAGVLVNIVIWNKDAELTSLLIGSGIICVALILNFIFEKNAANKETASH